ncbi:hypothetical protein JN27_11165 [Massilia sp. BSC265]|nr:hypothetical protein JN27_11165 [Massilia sp. BSC265]
MAKDFLNSLARQVVGGAVQAISDGAARPAQNHIAGTTTSPAAPAARPAYVRAGAQPPRMRLGDGTVFYGDYIADYWSRPDAATRGSTPDTDALGNIVAKPAHFSGNQKKPEFAQLQRKLETVATRVLQHPALDGIRGASLVWFADFKHDNRGPLGHALPGRLRLIAYPIRLGDPATKRYPDGTHHTPGEGPVLEITVNDPDEIGTRQPNGSWKGMTVLRKGYMFVLSNTDRPLYVDDGGRMIVNPDLVDKSRPRSDIQFMTVYVGDGSHVMGELTHKRIEPTSNTGRLIGTLYNTDWQAVLHEANAVR